MAVPTSDFYSQVPSLEHLSEKQRRRLVWQAATKRGDAIWVIPMSLAVAVTGLWLAVGWKLMTIVAAAMGPPPAQPSATAVAAAAFGGPTPVAATPAVPPALKTILFGLAVLVFIFAWLITRRVLVIRTVKRLINRVACPTCEFSLRGLKPQGAYVTCPECGERVNLYEHGLSPDDLVLERDKHKPFEGAGRFGAYKVPKKPPARSAPRH
jgi:hypothetical protein